MFTFHHISSDSTGCITLGYLNLPFFSSYFLVKLHLQGYSVHTLSYLSSSPIPYNEDEEVFRAKFEQWRVIVIFNDCLFMYFIAIVVFMCSLKTPYRTTVHNSTSNKFLMIKLLYFVRQEKQIENQLVTGLV